MEKRYIIYTNNKQIFKGAIMITLLTQTANMTPDDVKNQINDILLSNIENINSTFSNFLTIIGIIIAISGVLATINFSQRKKIKNEVMVEISKELDELKQIIIRQTDEKTNNHIHNAIQRYKENSQEEEYYRNMMFKDLSDILASEIHVNDTNNLKDVFNLHALRYELIAKLTSGKEKETKEALKRLTRGDYAISKLLSFKKYITILERKTDINIQKELNMLKNSLN
jgi:CRISPR/Cas system CMR-associated protein Cmr5 small subunit